MEETPNAPRSLAASTRLYQALLAVYPSDFRRAYGEPMLQAFRDCSRRALHEHGNAGLLALWGRTMLDTAQTAIEEHTQRGVDMSKEKFIKLSGWAMMLGPLIFLVGGWANNRPEYHRLNASSLPIDRYANVADTPLTVLGMVLMSLGIVGMMLRYTPKWNGASFLLGLSAVGGIASAVGFVMTALETEGEGWMVMLLGFAVQYLALAIFGLLSLRQRLLPRWNGLPILALWFPITLVLSSGLIPLEISNQMLAGLWVISIVMFAGLGYLLQSDPQPAGIAAAAA